MKTFKRLLCILLTALMFASTVPVSAETVDGERRMHTLEDAMAFWEQELGYEIPTKTYYFYYPDSWKFEANEYYDSSVGLESCLPAIYWYGDSTGNPNKYPPYEDFVSSGYPGYVLNQEVAPNVYKAEIPADVEIIVFSNGVCYDKAGQRWCEGFEYTRQVADTPPYYEEDGDAYGFYPDGNISAENMIMVVDPNSAHINMWREDLFSGVWFYYYGNGEYGSAPTKELAGAFVYSNGEFPTNRPQSAQSEITTIVGGEAVIDVNLTDTTATVEDESVATISQQKDTGDWVVTGLSVGETNVVISKGEQTVTVKVKVEIKKDITVPKVKITKITAKNPKVAVVKWSVSGEADGYEIQMKKAGGKFRTVKTVKSKKRLWAKIKGLKSATKYQFRVRGYVQGEEKIYGKFSKKKAVLTLPVKVKITGLKAKTAHSVTMKWKKAIGADGYIILRKAKGEKAYKTTMMVESPKINTAVLKGLKSKHKYFFKVISYAKSRGQTAYGNESKAVGIRTPKLSKDSMKFYPEFPRVPRMGCIAKTYSRHTQEIEQDGHDFVFYYYDKKQVTQWEREWYVETLKNYRFKFYEKWKNNDGTRVFSYTRNTTTVMITENKDYVVVGVVRA